MEDSDATTDPCESSQGILDHFGFPFVCFVSFPPFARVQPLAPWLAAQIAAGAGRFQAKGALVGITCLAYLHVAEEVPATVAWEVHSYRFGVESWATWTSSEHLSRHQLVPRLQTCLPKFQPQKDDCAHLLCLHLLDAGERSVKAWMRVMWFSISSKRATY